MQGTGNEQPAINPRTDVSKEQLRRLALLQPTDELVAYWLDLKDRMENGRPHPKYVVSSWQTMRSSMRIEQDEVDRAAAMVQFGNDRDAIQATRPEGCWCLGLGGRGLSVIPRMAYYDAEDVFAEFCPCPDGQQERDRVNSVINDRRIEERRLRLGRHWDNCGVPKRFRDLRIDTSPLRESMPELIGRLLAPSWEHCGTDTNAQAWKACEAAQEEWERSWFLWGDYGTGKTGLAVGYAWAYLHSTEERVFFRALPDLLADIRATYNRPRRNKFDPDEAEQETESDLIERLASIPLLVLDDLGAEQVKETGDGSWLADRLFQIIGKRHAENLTTVFTSNLNIEQIAKRIGERLTWRIVEMCGKDHIIHVTGKNLRA